MLEKRPSSADLPAAVWIDLVEPREDERRAVETATGLRVPTHDQIREIEFSSRIFLEGEALYFSTPVLDDGDIASAKLATVGFVLSAKRLVTVRFARIAVFDRLLSDSAAARGELSSRDAFLEILELIIDHAADGFERASAELDQISNAAFRGEHPPASRVAAAGDALHTALRRLGRLDDGISHVRDTLLGIERVLTFVLEGHRKQHLLNDGPRLRSMRADVASLEDYQGHLSRKVQFLLDATLGFISIQQNDIVKTLTIVSVVGVPPLLIAGIYGMNFKHMPELDWSFGYPAALGLIVISALAPVAWFKWRGWM